MDRRSNPDASDGDGTVRRLRRACVRLWTSTKRVAFGSEADATRESDDETTDWESMADFTLETGYTPERYVLELLDERGGEVVRVQVGAENVVYLPAAAPDVATPSDGTPLVTT